MYSVNETIEAKFLLLHPTTGLPVTGATVVSTLYDETDTIHSYPTVTEIGNGLYTASFVPDTAGEWTIIFGCSTPVQSGGLTFPVGLGICKDVEDKVDTVDTNVDSVLADTNELQTDWTNGGRLDLLLDGVKTKTDLIGASVAPSNEYDTEMARITGNVALEATLTAIKGSGWTTETLKAIYDSISGLNDITAASVWAVSTRSLTDKSDFTLSTTGIDNIRKSVCTSGDTTNSIGKILYDLYNTRLTLDRCSYLDNINNANLSTIPAISATRISYLDNINNSELLNITSTILGRIDASISSRSSHSASDIWSVPTRALTDKTNFSLSTTGIDDIRKSVCLTGDTASSIGKILFDLNARLTSTRAGYLDNLSGGAVALNSTVAKEATLTHATYGLDKIKTETASLVSKVDTIDSIVDLIKIETDKIANATYGLSALNTDLDTLISNLAIVDNVVDAVKTKTDLLFAVSSSSVSHDITTANDTVETVIEEIEDTNNYSLSLFFDLDSLESASEGEVVTIKLYNKIDGSNYSDSPIAVSEYVVGSEIEYPSIETNVLSGYSKITISCSGEVTATRSIVCRILKRNM